MAIKNFASSQRKQKAKRLLSNFSSLNLRTFIFSFLFFTISERFLISCASEITLKIEGGGNQRFINAAFESKINKVTVDNDGSTGCRDTCNLSEGEHNVVIEFKDGEVNLCNQMFLDLTNIREINLNSFDASGVTEMNEMFKNCANLQTVTFGNMGAHNAYTMGGLFEGCKKLSTVDLDKLSMTPVKNINYMFKNCSSLNSITLGETNTLYGMLGLFQGCNNLVSVDISQIKTSDVAEMKMAISRLLQLTKHKF